MRSAEEIENELEKLRHDLQISIGDLADQVSPAANIERAKAEAKNRFEQNRQKMLSLIEDAKKGDFEARKKLAIMAGIGLLTGLLLLRKIF